MMTDNEIIKALEYCVNVKSCNECNKPNPRPCTVIETKDILDLIKRKDAEIERLQIRNKTLSAITRNYNWKFAKAKSEAIKEFAERLKEELRLITENNGGFMPSVIDNLVKEMTNDLKE